MQSLAAYSFEISLDDVDTRLRFIDAIVDAWLQMKGADLPRASEGSFVSKTGDGTGQFLRQIVESPVGSLREIELIETAHTGSMFTTNVQVGCANKRIAVFASLHAAPGESRIAPVNLYPRCPGIIRTMIERFQDWKFAGQEVPLGQAFDAREPEKAQELCNLLRSETRRFPVVVVSDDEDEAVWQNLDLKVAEHLIGLADVAVVSAESSWVLTDELGPRDSCYLGAVRVYWPDRRPDGSIPGIKRLAPRLAALGTDEFGRNKLLAILRREVMSVAALTMFPPVVFKEIRQAYERQRLQSLESKARDKELDSIIQENSNLTEALAEAEQTIQSLKWKLASAGYASREVGATNDDAASDNTEDPDQPTQPQAGDTRYYKKIGSGGGVDSLVETKACQHKESNWRPSFKGDQAEKGLLKLVGRNDWRSIAHCSACTGGGRWRVNW